MFGSQVIDVAIGMIFVYLLLSLICSAANEAIESKLKNRAQDLEKGIKNLLGDKGLAEKLYGHDLINGLFSEKDKGKPSYIPSKTFALALLNIVFPDGGSAVPANQNILASFRQTIASLPADSPVTPIKDALLALIDDAQGDIEKFRKNVEDWYDAAMDRVSGWYKRRAHAIILVLGLLISIGLNADTVYIAQRLVSDPGTRNGLVAAAQAYEKEVGAAQPTADAKDALKTNLQKLESLGLPLGWNIEPPPDPDHPEAKPKMDLNLKWPGLRVWHKDVIVGWYGQIRFHWLGWILTALAISLGAPFWFDMLNKIIVVRSTVKPKEKSPEDKSKD
jgi:hypothetical protein